VPPGEPILTEIRREELSALRERELGHFAELRPPGMRPLERARPNMRNGVPMAWMATFYEHPPIVVERGSGAAFTDIDVRPRALQRPAPLYGQPRRLGGDRLGGARLRHSGDRG
jgi:hypothetical protein